MVASAAEAWVTSRALLARTQSSCINKDGQRRVRKLAKERRKKTERENGHYPLACAMAAASVTVT